MISDLEYDIEDWGRFLVRSYLNPAGIRWRVRRLCDGPSYPSYPGYPGHGPYVLELDDEFLRFLCVYPAEMEFAWVGADGSIIDNAAARTVIAGRVLGEHGPVPSQTIDLDCGEDRCRAAEQSTTRASTRQL